MPCNNSKNHATDEKNRPRDNEMLKDVLELLPQLLVAKIVSTRKEKEHNSI